MNWASLLSFGFYQCLMCFFSVSLSFLLLSAEIFVTIISDQRLKILKNVCFSIFIGAYGKRKSLGVSSVNVLWHTLWVSVCRQTKQTFYSSTISSGNRKFDSIAPFVSRAEFPGATRHYICRLPLPFQLLN